MPIFELVRAIPVKNHEWKFGSDWLSLSKVIMVTEKKQNWIFREQKSPIRGVTFDLWCPFSNSDELFMSKVMCENLVWIGWNRRYVNFQGEQKPPIMGGYMWPAMPIFVHGWAISVKSLCENLVWIGWAFQELSWQQKKKIIIEFSGRQKSPVRGVTFDFWCPFSNSDELFQSKVTCENFFFGLVEIRGMLIFRGRQKPIFVHGQAISLKSLVWKFGLDWLSLSRVIVVTEKIK